MQGVEITDMRSQEKGRDLAREIRRFEAEQRNAALAAKFLRINSNYDPFWNISPRAPLVQRIGVGILGSFFLSSALASFVSDLKIMAGP